MIPSAMTEYLNDQRLHTVSFYDIRGFVHHKILAGPAQRLRELARVL